MEEDIRGLGWRMDIGVKDSRVQYKVRGQGHGLIRYKFTEIPLQYMGSVVILLLLLNWIMTSGYRTR